MVIAVFILTFTVSAMLCHLIARKRKSDAVFWGVLGAVFGPLAIPFVFFSKTNRAGLKNNTSNE